jgi:hypothetical protein
MRAWALGLLGGVAFAGLMGCAARPPRPGPAERQEMSAETRAFVDRLRADDAYRPAPTGGQCVSCWVELPRGAYVAQGWWGWPLFGGCCCPAYPSCAHARTWLLCDPSPCPPRGFHPGPH